MTAVSKTNSTRIDSLILTHTSEPVSSKCHVYKRPRRTRASSHISSSSSSSSSSQCHAPLWAPSPHPSGLLRCSPDPSRCPWSVVWLELYWRLRPRPRSRTSSEPEPDPDPVTRTCAVQPVLSWRSHMLMFACFLTEMQKNLEQLVPVNTRMRSPHTNTDGNHQPHESWIIQSGY